MKNLCDIIVAIAAGGGLFLGLYNCLLELVRRRPRAEVHIRKIVRKDGFDVGFSATAVNTGEATFTVCAFDARDKRGERIHFTPMDGCDHLPKVIHPGEQCQIKGFHIGDKDAPVTGDVVRFAFILPTGKEFRSKKLPRAIES